MAKREIETEESCQQRDKGGKATVISKCLNTLTDLSTAKSKEKRLQAIDDMVRLCQTSTYFIADPLEQNKYVKRWNLLLLQCEVFKTKIHRTYPKWWFGCFHARWFGWWIAGRWNHWKYIALVSNEETGSLSATSNTCVVLPCECFAATPISLNSESWNHLHCSYWPIR